MSDEGKEPPAVAPSPEKPSSSGGFIRFYGLFWRKNLVTWRRSKPPILLGQPDKWLGSGKIAYNFDYRSVQLNFAAQKGVYVLYDQDLKPVYAGQAVASGERTLGSRLNDHRVGYFRDAWTFFSWFGFLNLKKFDLRKEKDRSYFDNPRFLQEDRPDQFFKETLDSFEAIIVESLSPRFNARGGNLKGSVLVDQYDEDLKKAD